MNKVRWIEDVDPDGPPSEAARRTLDQRLAAVWQVLPLAAHHAEDDVEYVHELRVATRRSMAAIRLFEPLLQTKPARSLIKDLKRAREAAGAARDLDVMLKRHAQDAGRQGERFLRALRKRRRKAQRPIQAQYRRLSKHGRFSRRVDELLAGIGSSESDAPDARFAEWARKRLRDFVDDFFAAQPTDPSDLSALHRFRIRGKRLRYAMELLAPAFPPSLREDLYPQLVRLQDHLGEINDHVVAAARLERWLDEDRRGMKADHLQGLLRRELERRDRAHAAYRDAWDSQRLAHLANDFEAVLGGATASRQLKRVDPKEREYPDFGVG